MVLECAGLLHDFPEGSLKRGKDTEVKESKGIRCKVSQYSLGHGKTLFLCFLFNIKKKKPPPNKCIFLSVLITSSKCPLSRSRFSNQTAIKCRGPSAQPDLLNGLEAARLRPAERRLCRNRCQRRGLRRQRRRQRREWRPVPAGPSSPAPAEAALPPVRLHSRPCAPTGAGSAPAHSPVRPPARWPAHSLSGAAVVSSPEPLLGPGRAAGGWVCWLCPESRRVTARPAATDN